MRRSEESTHGSPLNWEEANLLFPNVLKTLPAFLKKEARRQDTPDKTEYVMQMSYDFTHEIESNGRSLMAGGGAADFQFFADDKNGLTVIVDETYAEGGIDPDSTVIRWDGSQWQLTLPYLEFGDEE